MRSRSLFVRRLCTMDVVSYMLLTAMVQAYRRLLLSPYGGLSALYAILTVETRPYGIVKAMSFRMSFRTVASDGSIDCPRPGRKCIPRERRSIAQGSRLERRSSESQSQETHGRFQLQSRFVTVLTPVFIPSLSMFHSLPNSKILLEEILGS